VLEPVVLRRLAALPVGPTLGRLLAQVVADKIPADRLVSATVDDRQPRTGSGYRTRRPAGRQVAGFVDRAVAAGSTPS
jgi:hypothetical protein